jgi:hypothetical protein
MGTDSRNTILRIRKLSSGGYTDGRNPVDRLTPQRSPSRDINTGDGEQDQQERGSQDPQEGDEAAQPEKKTKKAKKTRKVTFDNVS